MGDEEAADIPTPKREGKKKKRNDRAAEMQFVGHFDIAKQSEALARAFANGASSSRESLDTLQKSLTKAHETIGTLMTQNLELLGRCGQATEMSVIGAILERDKSSVMTTEVILAFLNKLESIGAPLAAVAGELARKRFQLPQSAGAGATSGAKTAKAAFVRLLLALDEHQEAIDAVKAALVKHHALSGSSDPAGAAESDWLLILTHGQSVSEAGSE